MKVTAATLAKDLRIEWRSKDAVNAMGFFALLVVVIFAFSFEPTAEESRRIAGGIIWMAVLFASVIALNQAWTRELRNQVLDALRLPPGVASQIFVAKLIGNFLFVAAVQLVLAPVFIAFYNLRSVGPLWELVITFFLGTWALVVVGTFFGALTLRTRSREVMLPLLLFPIAVPAMIAMVQATTYILTGEASPGIWIKLLAGYDVVFTTASLLLFELVLHAE
jgi:heme exporter protein B